MLRNPLVLDVPLDNRLDTPRGKAVIGENGAKAPSFSFYVKILSQDEKLIDREQLDDSLAKELIRNSGVSIHIDMLRIRDAEKVLLY